MTRENDNSKIKLILPEGLPDGLSLGCLKLISFMAEEINIRLKMRRDGRINPYVSVPQKRMREFCGGNYKRKVEQLTDLGIIQVLKSKLGVESYRAAGGKGGTAFCKAYKFSFAIQRDIRAGRIVEREIEISA